MKKIVYIIIPLIFLFAAGCNTFMKSSPPAKVIKNSSYTSQMLVGKNILHVEIVRDPDSMAEGLSGREPLTDEQGMLFDYGNSTSVTPTFWMKEMNFDLDLIWIHNNIIVGITKNVPKPNPGDSEKNLPLYNAPSPINQVLEVNAGWSEGHGVVVGDKVEAE